MDIFNSNHNSRSITAETKVPETTRETVRETAPETVPKAAPEMAPAAAAAPKANPRPAKAEATAADRKTVSGYQAYKASLRSYAADLKQEAELEKRIQRAKQQQNAYEQVWQAAGQNAQKAWQSNQNSEQLAAQRQRDSLRKNAQAEKQARLREINQTEATIKEKLDQLELAGQKAAAEDTTCRKKLENAGNYVVEGFDCDPRAERIIKGGAECGYLSPKQRELAAQAPEVFCRTWAPTLDALKNLEAKLFYTGFFNQLQQSTSDERAYEPVIFSIGGVAVVLMFLFMVLNSLSDNALFRALGRVGVFFGIAFIWYVVAAGVAKFIKRHKDVKVHNSASGVIACVFAFLCAASAASSVRLQSTLVSSVGSCLVMSFLGGMMFAMLLSQSVVQRIMVKIPWVMSMIHKNIYLNAGRTENRRRAKNNEAPLQKDEMDAIIVCYVNHQAILRYLSQNARDNFVQELKKQQQQIQALSARIAGSQAEWQDKQRDLQRLRMETERKNRETDAKLEADLKEIDRRYGKSSAPDFSQRANLLADDKNRLAVMEKQIGIRESDAGDRESAVRACSRVFAQVYDRMTKVQNSIKENIRVIRDWNDGDHRPPLVNEDGSYNYQLEPSICLLNTVDPLDERPAVIEHGCNPINLVYANGTWDDENAAVLIKEIWKGFARVAPPELIHFSIVDDTMRVGYSLGDSYKLPEFNRYYQNGFETDTNRPSRDDIVIPVRGLYDKGNIEKIDQDLNQKITNIQSFINKNESEISEARNVTGSEENITIINYYTIRYGTSQKVYPYHIVVFVVPEASERNTLESGCLRSMQRLIEQKNGARKNGFIPIVLAAESDISERWLPMVNQVREKGVTYRVDLNSLRLNG